MLRRLIWPGLALAVLLPLIAAAFSPLLQWRSPIYISAGFAGIAAFALLTVQPLLTLRVLPALSPPKARLAHRTLGILLLALVIWHVAALWITSPPDVVDALTFRSPTPFSIWGVLAMWALFATALIAGLRKRIPPRLWRGLHKVLAVIVVGGTIIHALLITGTMEPTTKIALSALTALILLGTLIRPLWRS